MDKTKTPATILGVIGFDLLSQTTSAGGGCLVGHLKTTGAQLNANKLNLIAGMSVAEADAILKATGYVEKAELATV